MIFVGGVTGAIDHEATTVPPTHSSSEWESGAMRISAKADVYLFISPLFNQVGKLRTSSHLQLRPGQDKAKQFDRYNNTELHME